MRLSSRLLGSFIVVVLAATPAAAASRTCTSQMVLSGLCASTNQILLGWAVPPGIAAELEAEMCERFGYPMIPCAAPDVAAGRCTSGQLGQTVPTPETRGAFAQRMLGEMLRNLVRERRVRTAQDAARAGVADPGAIE